MEVNILNQLKQNSDSFEMWHSFLIIGYAFLFVIVMLCNLIAMLAGYRRYNKCKTEQLHRNRTELTRCILVIYLSFLDILLCLTIPLNAIDLLTIDVLYTNPNIDWICSYTKFVPAMVIYATSSLVILIAVDSYRNICQPLKSQLKPASSGYIFSAIIIVAFLFASPLFYSTHLIFIPVQQPQDMSKLGDEFSTDSEINGGDIHENFTYHLSRGHSLDLATMRFSLPDQIHVKSFGNHAMTMNMVKNNNSMIDNVKVISVCVENWEFLGNIDFLGDKNTGRLIYSIFSLIVQYLLPFITISILHAMVFSELKTQGKRRSQIIIQIEKGESSHTENGRMKRNTAVLTTMSLVFCFCWLPQNLIYIALDGYHKLFGTDPNTTVKISVICHWIGMASTWINPIIYGYLNTSIRQGMISNKIVSKVKKIIFK